MIIAEIRGEAWGEVPGFKDVLCTRGEILVTDTSDGTEEYADIVGGAFIKNNMVWTGQIGQPGYFAVKANVIFVVDVRERKECDMEED